MPISSYSHIKEDVDSQPTFLGPFNSSITRFVSQQKIFSASAIPCLRRLTMTQAVWLAVAVVVVAKLALRY